MTDTQLIKKLMLTAREQLMEDINTIMAGYDQRESPEYLTAILCDAVCKNFPLDD